MSLIIEKQFEYKGYPCIVTMTSMCHRCGYVGVSSTNSLFETEGYEIDCHGGVTFGNYSERFSPDEDTWWLGFDTAHFGDKKDIKSAVELFSKSGDKNTIKELALIIALEETFPSTGTVKTLDFCIEECKKIVEQVLEYDNKEEDL